MDIAQELEQYLNELELIEISFDGGVTTLNFAEAALLIQGSTCVYSRKVEYLYQLVFRVLDIIADRQRKAENGDGNTNNDDPDSAFPEEPEFISLDDIAPAKRSAIDMVEKPNASGVDNTVIPRSPILLMQINLEADVENSDPNKDFKLASAAVHSSGALLLEPRMQYLLDSNLQVHPCSKNLCCLHVTNAKRLSYHAGRVLWNEKILSEFAPMFKMFEYPHCMCI